jgi:hypothetical protein
MYGIHKEYLTIYIVRNNYEKDEEKRLCQGWFAYDYC